MNKIARYLNKNILGEVDIREAVRRHFSCDSSILQIAPEIVIYPKNTKDIVKIANFSWQFSQKGYRMPITVRGGGSDTSGAAIGSGIMLVMPAHMNMIEESDMRQGLIRVQSGITFKSVNDALSLSGAMIPSYPTTANYSTIGGAIANDSQGVLSGKYGSTYNYIDKLEVVLANGEVIQTGRKNKKQVNKLKGLSTFEGDVYRGLDGIYQDNKELIASISDHNKSGYANIKKACLPDGSIDIMPLLVGSQGSLGIVTEAILKTEFISRSRSAMVVVFDDFRNISEVLDSVAEKDPCIFEYISAETFIRASELGREYFVQGKQILPNINGGALIIAFDEHSKGQRNRKLKKTSALFSDNVDILMDEGEGADSILDLMSITSVVYTTQNNEETMPPIFDGAFIPRKNIIQYLKLVRELSEIMKIPTTIVGNVSSGIFTVRPILKLNTLMGKQKTFKMLDQYTKLVMKVDGYLAHLSGEGRLHSNFVSLKRDEKLTELYKKIKHVFDPYGILNPGVKEQNDLRNIIKCLRPNYYPVGQIVFKSLYK